MRRAGWIAGSMLSLGFAGAAQALSLDGVGDAAGGAVESRALAVSRDGTTVVGSTQSADGEVAYRWRALGGMQTLGDLDGGAFRSVARGVNGDGSLVAGEATNATNTRGFRWTELGGMQALGVTGQNSTATSVAADVDWIVGNQDLTPDEYAARFSPPTFGLKIFDDLSGGGNHSIAWDICPDGNVSVGASASNDSGSEHKEAAFWIGGETVAVGGLDDFPGGAFQSEAFGVDLDATVVVGYGTDAVGQVAFRWTAQGGAVALGGLAGGDGQSVAYDVDDDGDVIVGAANAEGGGTAAFIWDPVNGMRRVDALLGSLANGWTLTAARGVSGDGTVVVGEGVNPLGDTEGWIAVMVPEPGAAAAGLVAIAALRALRRRLS
jgi:uncharacterized membrane protein